MHPFWFLLAVGICMIVFYIYIEWKIMRYAIHFKQYNEIERSYFEKRIVLSGTIVSFVGAMAFYLGLMSVVRTFPSILCLGLLSFSAVFMSNNLLRTHIERIHEFKQ